VIGCIDIVTTSHQEFHLKHVSQLDGFRFAKGFIPEKVSILNVVWFPANARIPSRDQSVAGMAFDYKIGVKK
jgi:hypothetical protein